MPDKTDPIDLPVVGVNPFGERTDKHQKFAPSVSPATQRLPWIGVGSFLVLSAILNAAAIPIAENMFRPPDGLELIVFAVGLGMIGGQIGALSAILVWSRGSFVVRWVALWLTGMVLFACWAIGLLTMIDADSWGDDVRVEVVGAIAAGLPLISLAVQLPQWAARFYLGWRLESPGNWAGTPSSGLSIRDLLFGTVVAALTIAAARLSPPAAEMQSSFWLGWAIAVPIIAAISALVMLPLLVLIFRCSALWGLLYIAIGSPLLAGVTMTVIVLVDGSSVGPRARDVAGFLVAATSCVATTSIPLWLTRFAGYKLKMGREG